MSSESDLPPIPSNIGRHTTPEARPSLAIICVTETDAWHSHLQLYGMFCNLFLMGSLTVQVYQYYSSFPRDQTHLKALVYVLYLLELTQTGIMIYFAYTIFGSGYGNLTVFEKSALEWFPVCILGSLIAGIVQIFYGYRVYACSKSRIAAALICLLALLQVGSGIAQGVISKLAVDRSNLTKHPVNVTIWLASSAACDVSIASYMTFYLKRQPIRSAWLNEAVTRIVRYTIETGAATTIVAVVQLAVQQAYPEDNFFETPSWTLGKLYSNSLLVLLNARAIIVGGRNQSSEGQEEELYINGLEFGSRGGITATPFSDMQLSRTESRNSKPPAMALPPPSDS